MQQAQVGRDLQCRAGDRAVAEASTCLYWGSTGLRRGPARPASLGQSIEESQMGGQGLPLWGDGSWGSHSVTGHRPGWGTHPTPQCTNFVLQATSLVQISKLYSLNMSLELPLLFSFFPKYVWHIINTQ